MGLFDKLMKKLDRPQTDEVSPGGSAIYRYAPKDDTGFQPPENSGLYAKEIEAHFDAMFPGRTGFVLHELVSDLVHIDVHILEPAEDADYYVVYTTGMSDLPMTLPEELELRNDLKYAEIFFFMPSDWKPGKAGQLTSEIPQEEYWPIQMVKFLARFPHEYKTWLGYGHTIPNGPEYSPLCEKTGMGGVVLTQFEGDLGILHTENKTAVNLLMMIPAYKEEIEFKLKYGMSALDQEFEKNKLPLIIDMGRDNYCAQFREEFDR